MDQGILNYLLLTVIIGLLLTTWGVLASISVDNNNLLRIQGNILLGTGNKSNQEHISHLLEEILANTTASNGVLIPKVH